MAMINRYTVILSLVCFGNVYAQNIDTLSAKEYLESAIRHMQNDEFELARDNSLKAIELNPNYGQAYILIGQLYVQSADLCTEDSYSKGIIMCLAVDQFEKALHVDSTITETANKLINIYSKYFPYRESIPFGAPHEGHKYKINCWIDRETIVRYADY